MCVCVNLGRTCSRTTIRQSLPINQLTQIGIRREGEKLQTAARQAETPIGFHWPNQRRTTRTLHTPPAAPSERVRVQVWIRYGIGISSQVRVQRDRHIRDASKTRKKNNMKIPNTLWSRRCPGRRRGRGRGGVQLHKLPSRQVASCIMQWDEEYDSQLAS